MRLQIQNRPTDEFELISHVNETIGSLRRQIYIKTKLNPQINKIDLIINNECIECLEDNKTLSDYQLKEKLEKMYVVARITQSSSSSASSATTHHHHQTSCHHHQSPNLNSSSLSTGTGGVGGTVGTPTSGGGGGGGSGVGGGGGVTNRVESSAEDDDSSSSTTDECASSQDNEAIHHHNVVGSPNIDYELQLPSVILSLSEQYVQFLIDLADFGCGIRNSQIKECTRGIIDLLPIAKHTGERIKQLCRECAQKQQNPSSTASLNALNESGEITLEKFYFNCTQTQCWYNLKVTHALLLPAMYQYNPEETKQFQVKIKNIFLGFIFCFSKNFNNSQIILG